MVVRKVTAKEMLGGRSAVVLGNGAQGQIIKKYHEWKAASKAKVARAREFAIKAHGDQRYGSRPYEEHLQKVVGVLARFGYEADYLCAGWLHDVVEDTSITLDDIERSFGAEVARLVDAVSGGGDRATHVALIYEKIAAYPGAAIVKLADRIANLEASQPGDKNAMRYAREHDSFAAAIRPHVLPNYWRRYQRALRSRRGTGASA